jgi:hypothetical protein
MIHSRGRGAAIRLLMPVLPAGALGTKLHEREHIDDQPAVAT